MENLLQLEILNRIANKIVDSHKLTWEEKFHAVFHECMSITVSNFIDLDYYDPDTSYQEDAEAYVNAFNLHMIELRKNENYLKILASQQIPLYFDVVCPVFSDAVEYVIMRDDE